MRAVAWDRRSLCAAAALLAVGMLSRTGAEAASRRPEPTDDLEPIGLLAPVRGIWYAPNTPGSKIPSHGTNRLGTRYAYDFIQVDPGRIGWPAYRGGLLRYLLLGIPAHDYYCWEQEVCAPCAGEVARAEDGCEDRERTRVIADMAKAYESAHGFDPRVDDARSVAGNFVIIKMREGVYAALCHLRRGSVCVAAGRRVRAGEPIAQVGNSGNTFGPHLHLQLMDRDDIATARGLPCSFERYDALRDGAWRAVANGVPTDAELIRFASG